MSPTPKSPASAGGFTCILVHSAWGGGWDWKHVDQLLAAGGNEVYRPTLTGQGEHFNLSSTNIGLDTHIQDIVNVILWENMHNVVLVGHSYGGISIVKTPDAPVFKRILGVLHLFTAKNIRVNPCSSFAAPSSVQADFGFAFSLAMS